MKASVTSFLAAAMLLSPALNALVSASPLLVEERTPKPSCNADNPFVNRVQYVNSGYAAKLDQTIQSFLADGDKLNAARTRTVQKTVSTFVWISKYAEIEGWKKHLSEALKTQRRSPNKKLIFPMVVYNLPERDCSALASAGELTLDNDGMKKYKKYIDIIASEVDKYNDKFDFAVVLEPDSLGNIVTNLAVPKCQKAQPAYIDGLAYAIKKLQKKNVSLYIDAAHSNWLGWPGNLEPSAKLYKEVLTKAGRGAKIRGFATNVSNYNAYNATTPDIIYGAGPDNPNWSELRYVQALTPYLKAEGLPAHFIIDQGRSGAQNIRLKGGHWCNIKDSGFGIRPTTKTNDCTVDALVWVKPGGESDGTSDSTAVRFDENCQSPDAHIPAPEAGEWFDDFVQSLVINANPPLAPTY